MPLSQVLTAMELIQGKPDDAPEGWDEEAHIRLTFMVDGQKTAMTMGAGNMIIMFSGLLQDLRNMLTEYGAEIPLPQFD